VREGKVEVIGNQTSEKEQHATSIPKEHGRKKTNPREVWGEK